MKKTSYQKLKEENARLKSDIYKLVMKPETMDGIGVRFSWETKFGMAERCLAGSRIKPTEDGKITCTGGIIDRSSNAEDKGFVPIPECIANIKHPHTTSNYKFEERESMVHYATIERSKFDIDSDDHFTHQHFLLNEIMKGYPLPFSENEKQFRDSKIKEDLVERFVWAHRNEFWRTPEYIKESMSMLSIDMLYKILKSYINHGISIYPRNNETN